MDWKILLVTHGTLIIAALGAAWIGARALIRTNGEQLDQQFDLERKRRETALRSGFYEERKSLYARFLSATTVWSQNRHLLPLMADASAKAGRADDVAAKADQALATTNAVLGLLAEMPLPDSRMRLGMTSRAFFPSEL